MTPPMALRGSNPALSFSEKIPALLINPNSHLVKTKQLLSVYLMVSVRLRDTRAVCRDFDIAKNDVGIKMACRNKNNVGGFVTKLSTFTIVAFLSRDTRKRTSDLFLSKVYGLIPRTKKVNFRIVTCVANGAFRGRVCLVSLTWSR